MNRKVFLNSYVIPLTAYLMNQCKTLPLQQCDINVWTLDRRLETSVLNVWINLPTKHSSIRGISLDVCGNVYCCKSLRKKRNNISYIFLFILFYFIHFANFILIWYSLAANTISLATKVLEPRKYSYLTLLLQEFEEKRNDISYVFFIHFILFYFIHFASFILI